MELLLLQSRSHPTTQCPWAAERALWSHPGTGETRTPQLTNAKALGKLAATRPTARHPRGALIQQVDRAF